MWRRNLVHVHKQLIRLQSEIVPSYSVLRILDSRRASRGKVGAASQIFQSTRPECTVRNLSGWSIPRNLPNWMELWDWMVLRWLSILRMESIRG